MRKSFIPALILVGAAAFIWIAAVSAQGTPQIAGSKRVVVRPGGTVQFTGQNCPSASCGFVQYPGHDSTSSVTTGGLYTAPTTAPVLPKLGGCPVGMHNWIYSVRVDQATSGLPAYADSDQEIMQMMNGGNAAAYKSIHIYPGAPVNWHSNSAPFANFVGDRPPARMWDGAYRFTSPAITPIGSRTDPLSGTSTGWLHVQADNRYIAVNRDTCDVTEIYFLYGTPPGNTLPGPSIYGSSYVNYNMAGFYFYNLQDFLNGDGLKGVGTQGSTAGGTALVPLQISALQVIDAINRDGANGDVKHALAMTLPNTVIDATNYLWPATSHAGGCVPYRDGNGVWHPTPCPSSTVLNAPAESEPYGRNRYGTRYRLKPGFIASYNPALDSTNPRVQQMVMVMLHTVERYGIYLMDGTLPYDSFGIHSRRDNIQDKDYDAAISILATSKNIASNWTVTTTYNASKNLIANLEAVDESSLRASSLSNVVLAPYAKPERVIWRDLVNNVDLDYRDISIMMPTVGTRLNQMNVVSGATLPISDYVWASGLANNNALSYSVTSGPGTVSSGGLFTPAEVSVASSSTVRVSATENSAVYTDVRIITLPTINSKLCVRLSPNGNTTAGGCTWWGKDQAGIPLTIAGSASVTASVTITSFADSAYPSTGYLGGTSADFNIPLYMPNGRYKLTVLATTGDTYHTSCSTGDEHCNPSHKSQMEINNVVAMPAVHWWTIAGAAFDAGGHYTAPFSVTDGKMVLSWRTAGPGSIYPYVSSFVIEPDPAHPSVVLGNHITVGGGRVQIQQ